MALSLYYAPSFERSLKRLGQEQKKIVGLILEVLAVYYSNGCDLIEARKVSLRFFYKKLRNPYYEAGIEVTLRVVIKKEGERGIAILAGNHDQVKQFLAKS